MEQLQFLRLDGARFDALCGLHRAYKEAIGEDAPTQADLDRLLGAMEREKILFYGCVNEEGQLVGCCSVSPTFSTYTYATAGVFEDFYILPAFRHRGIARRLVSFAVEDSGVSSLTVGCADCDAEMYKAMGFTVPLGNLLAFEL